MQPAMVSVGTPVVLSMQTFEWQHMSYNSTKLAIGVALVLLSILISKQVKKSLLGSESSPSEKLRKSHFFRGMIFFGVSIAILWRSHAILAFLEVSFYPWYVPLVMTAVSAAFVAFMPETVMFSLFTWPIIILMSVGTLQEFIVLVLFASLAIAFFLAPYAMYFATIWFPTLWCYERWGTTHASVYVLIWMTFFFVTIRFLRDVSFKGATSIWLTGRRLGRSIRDSFSPWAIARILAKMAHSLGILLGGDVWRQKS